MQTGPLPGVGLETKDLIRNKNWQGKILHWLKFKLPKCSHLFHHKSLKRCAKRKTKAFVCSQKSQPMKQRINLRIHGHSVVTNLIEKNQAWMWKMWACWRDVTKKPAEEFGSSYWERHIIGNMRLQPKKEWWCCQRLIEK